MKPPPPRRAHSSAGLDGHARVGPKTTEYRGCYRAAGFGVPLRGRRPALQLLAGRGFRSVSGLVPHADCLVLSPQFPPDNKVIREFSDGVLYRF